MLASDPVIEHLYQTHARELHGFARRRVGRQEAEDVVQDAYLHLLQKGAVGELAHPRAYLFRIAANLAVDVVRKTRTRLRYAGEEAEFFALVDATSAPEEAIERACTIRRFEACLAELPARYREVFRFSLIEGLTHAEIATRLGISVRTVDRNIVRALDHVRRRLSPQTSRREDPGSKPTVREMPIC